MGVDLFFGWGGGTGGYVAGSHIAGGELRAQTPGVILRAEWVLSKFVRALFLVTCVAVGFGEGHGK